MKKTKKKIILSAVLFIFVLWISLSVSSCTYRLIPDKLLPEITMDKINTHIKKLSGIQDFRITGFDGEKTAAAYIKTTLQSYNTKPVIQTFPIISFKALSSLLQIKKTDPEKNQNYPENRIIQSKPFFFSISTAKDGIMGDLIYAQYGFPEDFNTKNFNGKIVLVKRGEIPFKVKADNAYKAGAIGVIIFNNEPELMVGSLLTPSAIPVLGISGEDGEELLSTLNNGIKITLNFSADTIIKHTESENIIVNLKGKNDKFYIIGAHYDSVDTPGANDNASSVSLLLEMARILSGKKLPVSLKFIFFGAEEIGLKGSEYYAASMKNTEKKNCLGIINIDCIGTGNSLLIGKAINSPKTELHDLALNLTEKYSLPAVSEDTNESDHASFAGIGIPNIFFITNPHTEIHTAKDTFETIDQNMFGQMCHYLFHYILLLENI